MATTVLLVLSKFSSKHSFVDFLRRCASEARGYEFLRIDERPTRVTEPARDFRRLHFLRKWSYGKHQEEVPKVLAGSS
ncbi:hypothetical protein OKW41_004643 [Paraburkholderia sp. UCT70]|uniref:hypothetical protein n=1 Tax=Paraburkholderia sp. UCT70 TaxID=2991068 RepID=UPI003D19F3F2